VPYSSNRCRRPYHASRLDVESPVHVQPGPRPLGELSGWIDTTTGHSPTHPSAMTSLNVARSEPAITRDCPSMSCRRVPTLFTGAKVSPRRAPELGAPGSTRSRGSRRRCRIRSSLTTWTWLSPTAYTATWQVCYVAGYFAEGLPCEPVRPGVRLPRPRGHRHQSAHAWTEDPAVDNLAASDQARPE